MTKEEILKEIDETIKQKWQDAFVAFKEANSCELGICPTVKGLVSSQKGMIDNPEKWQEIANKVTRIKQATKEEWAMTAQPINQLIIAKYVIEGIEEGIK